MRAESVVSTELRNHRPIRSYVRRMGRITKSQKAALREEQQQLIVPATNLPQDPQSWFSKSQPLVLEIGFGMGENLIHQAQLHPEWNFLGIDVHEPGLGACCQLCRLNAIDNVRLMATDVTDVLKEVIQTPALSQVFILFPDPWPKKKHHKRRMIQVDFIALIAKRLQANGLLHIMTDWAEYAEHIRSVMQQSTEFRDVSEAETTFSASRITTKFEAKGLRKGHQIYAGVFQRIPACVEETS